MRSPDGRATTERKAMAGGLRAICTMMRSQAERAPRGKLSGHGLERDSHLRIIRDYVGEANPKGYIILYYRMVAVGVYYIFLV